MKDDRSQDRIVFALRLLVDFPLPNNSTIQKSTNSNIVNMEHPRNNPRIPPTSAEIEDEKICQTRKKKQGSKLCSDEPCIRSSHTGLDNRTLIDSNLCRNK